MPIIKPNTSNASAMPFSMRVIEDEARAILLRARQQAERLIAAAQVEGEELRKQAMEEGRKEGHAAGLKQGTDQGKAAGTQQALNEQKQNLTNLVKAMSDAAAQLDDQRKQLETEGVTEVVKLAIAIARRITRRMSEIDPAVVVDVATGALRLVNESTDVRIALHSADMQTMKDALPQLKLAFPTLQHVEFVDDVSVERGGCRIRTRGGLIDADLSTQIDRITNDLIPGSPAT